MGTYITIYYDQYESPIGSITIMTYQNDLVRIDFGSFADIKEKARKYLVKIKENIYFKPSSVDHWVKKELDNYFAKRSFHFPNVHTFYGTTFQKEVWLALLRIPYGQTVSYKDVAQMINRPKAARAIGGAVNKNPLSIVVPCHRVIGADGSLVGYGGGIDRKHYLLKHEKLNDHSM